MDVFAREDTLRAVRQNTAMDETLSHLHTMSTNTVSVTSMPLRLANPADSRVRLRLSDVQALAKRLSM